MRSVLVTVVPVNSLCRKARCKLVVVAVRLWRSDVLVVGVERQAQGLSDAALALRRAAGQGALELAAEELRCARVALASVRGREAAGDVLDQVFRQFCIGK